jgi:hypothetical protein
MTEAGASYRQHQLRSCCNSSINLRTLNDCQNACVCDTARHVQNPTSETVATEMVALAAFCSFTSLHCLTRALCIDCICLCTPLAVLDCAMCACGTVRISAYLLGCVTHPVLCMLVPTPSFTPEHTFLHPFTLAGRGKLMCTCVLACHTCMT